MRKTFQFLLLLLLISYKIAAQTERPEDFGYRRLQTIYKQDTVNILVLSKKGDEKHKKPLFLFIQGWLPKPLIILQESGKPYMVFPFQSEIFLHDYHLAIISKPCVPLIRKASELRADMAYLDSAGKFPEQYMKRDNLNYYANRNKAVIKYLKKQSWVNNDEVVVAGHSDGAVVAAKLAAVSKDVTHLIFASSNPLGRMTTIITQIRQQDDSVGTITENQIKFWEEVVNEPKNNDIKNEITYKSIYSYSLPPLDTLRKLRIPVMVAYGTKDIAAPFFDYMRVEIIRNKIKNFTFMPYVGREHNFFGFHKNGQVNYDDFGWDKVAMDWNAWLKKD
ncbi:alpha/beta hydrolase [Adhaeribacter rhizoryzae]|uniref:Alpha/beta hydrolase n=1 Tax=Adhaeribacter rhizoryzae TaxID=2607907 RepID=A0A5M6CY43_9BACT|nr:hypothetical protein [Adhaeribacter rhizoryzae]KAA5540137.1 hypothetical protein F0145_23205 [Adhaeribacter rhizoryzae]